MNSGCTILPSHGFRSQFAGLGAFPANSNRLLSPPSSICNLRRFSLPMAGVYAGHSVSIRSCQSGKHRFRVPHHDRHRIAQRGLPAAPLTAFGLQECRDRSERRVERYSRAHGCRSLLFFPQGCCASGSFFHCVSARGLPNALYCIKRKAWAVASLGKPVTITARSFFHSEWVPRVLSRTVLPPAREY